MFECFSFLILLLLLSFCEESLKILTWKGNKTYQLKKNQQPTSYKWNHL